MLGFYYPVLSLSKILILTTLVVTDPALTLSCINKLIWHLMLSVLVVAMRQKWLKKRKMKSTWKEKKTVFQTLVWWHSHHVNVLSLCLCACQHDLHHIIFAFQIYFNFPFLHMWCMFIFLALFFYLLVKIDIFFITHDVG